MALRALPDRRAPWNAEARLADLDDPEYKERVRNHVILADGTSLIAGLDKRLERELAEIGGGRVKVIKEPIYTATPTVAWRLRWMRRTAIGRSWGRRVGADRWRSGDRRRLVEIDPLTRHEGVDDIGIEVRAVRPADGTKLGVNAELAEHLVLGEIGENAPELDEIGDVHLSFDTVLEADVDVVTLQRSGLDDVLEHGGRYVPRPLRSHLNLLF
jgi:hypothetical protein